MNLDEVYEKYKHLDELLSNPIDNTSINLTARDLWLAIKEHRPTPRAADLPETWAEDEYPSACTHRKACIFYQPASR